MLTIREALLILKERIKTEQGNSLTLSRYLVEDLLQRSNLPDDHIIEFEQWQRILEAAGNLNAGMPLQYVTGIAHFYGLQFHVDPSVLIPRPETEELVYEIISDIKRSKIKTEKLLDIGTGSGCIAITLKRNFPSISVVALDKSEAAINTAMVNAENLESDIEFIRDNILKPQKDPIVQGQWDLIVSNPPYIEETEREKMDEHVLLYEPLDALFPMDISPLGMYEQILQYGRKHLNPGGRIYLELNEYLGESINLLAVRMGYSDVRLIKDLQGKFRILKGIQNSVAS